MRTKANPKRVAVSCTVCGASFVRLSSLQRTCSQRCRGKAEWQRAKAKPPSKNRGAVNMKYRGRLRAAAIAAMGGKCARCGFDDERCLQFDHRVPLHRGKNGMSSKDETSDKTYKAVLDGARATYELLCANCHCIKTREDHRNGVEAVLPVINQLGFDL